MGKLIDLTGIKFGRLTVISRCENNKSGLAQWECKCECGNSKIAVGKYLKNGDTKSCGCIRVEKLILRNKQCITHGMTHTRLYCIWNSIKDRILNENCKDYHRYGGRGIGICVEWKDSFETFYNWSMCNNYTDELTIDRIDNDGHYEPSNCRWVTRKVQANNSSNNRLVTIDGVTKNIAEWSEITGINYNTFRWRLRNGWRGEDLLK